MNPTFPSERRGAAGVRHAVAVAATTFAQSVPTSSTLQGKRQSGGGERLHAWGDAEIQGRPSFGAFGAKLLINYEDLSEDPSEIYSCKTRYSVTDVRG